MAYFHAGFASHTGDRGNNEDACLVATRTGDPKAGPQQPGIERIDETSPFDLVLVVGDGMGGGAHGEIASRVLIESVRELFVRGKYQDWVSRNGLRSFDQAGVLREFLRFVNTQLIQLANQKGVDRMGTTADLLVVRDGEFFYAHVGDSRIYHAVDGQSFRQITTDHNVGQYAAAHGIQASAIGRKNMVTSILGGSSALQVDVGNGPVSDGTAFLLCTDGLDRMKPDDFADSASRHQKEWMTVAGELVSRGVNRRKPAADNATVVIAQCSKEKPAEVSSGTSSAAAIAALDPSVQIEVEEFTHTSLEQFIGSLTGQEDVGTKSSTPPWLLIGLGIGVPIALCIVGLIVWLAVRHVDSQPQPPEMPAGLVETSSAETAAITPIDPEQFDLQREDFTYRFTTITNELHTMQINDFPRWRSAARTNVWSIVLSNRNEAAAQLDAWTENFAEPLTQLVQSNRFLVEGVPPGAITEGLFDPDALEPWAETDLLIAPSNQLAHLHGQLQGLLLEIGLQYTNRAGWLETNRVNASQMIGQAVPEITSMRRQLGRFLTGNERAGFAHTDPTLTTVDDEVAQELLERLLALRRTLHSHPLNQGQQLHIDLRDFAPISREASDAGVAQMQDLGAVLGRAGEFRNAYRQLTNNWQAVTTDLQAEIERRRTAREKEEEDTTAEQSSDDDDAVDVDGEQGPVGGSASADDTRTLLTQFNEFKARITAIDIHATRLTTADADEWLRLWNEEGTQLAATVESPAASGALTSHERNMWRLEFTAIRDQAALYVALDDIMSFTETAGQLAASDRSLQEKIEQARLSERHQDLLLPLAGLLEEVAAGFEVDAQGRRFPQAITYTVKEDDTISKIIRAEFGGTYPFERRPMKDVDNAWVEMFRVLNNRSREHWDRILLGQELLIPVWRAASTAMPEAQFNATKEAIDRLERSEVVADQLLANVMLHSLFWVRAESRILFDKTSFRGDLEGFLSGGFLRARGRTWPRIDR